MAGGSLGTRLHTGLFAIYIFKAIAILIRAFFPGMENAGLVNVLVDLEVSGVIMAIGFAIVVSCRLSAIHTIAVAPVETTLASHRFGIVDRILVLITISTAIALGFFSTFVAADFGETVTIRLITYLVIGNDPRWLARVFPF